MTTRAWLIGGAVAGMLSVGAWSIVQAAPLPAPRPAPAPTRAFKLKNPAGTAKTVAALARFANGQLGDGAYDRRVAATLGKLPGARDTAKRLVAAIEAMPASERGKTFPGVKGPETLTSKSFDRPSYQASTSEQAKAAAAAAVAVGVTTLAPDPFDAKKKSQYELVYRGAKCDVAADPDGTDEPVVYVNVIGREFAANQWKYVPAPKFLPDSGTLTAAAGALTTAGAGPVWTSASFPGGWGNSVVIVTAVLEDDGDLAQRKQELELLVQFALSETEEDTLTQDRMEVLRRELEDALALLHLANPDRWSAKAIAVKKLTSGEYDDLYLAPSTAAPVPHKLAFQHDPRGSAYTLYFDVPPPVVAYKTVFVKIKEIEALGDWRDAKENKIADLGLKVAIDGTTAANVVRRFAADRNLVKPGWTVERQIPAGGTATIELAAFDDDAAPSCACLEAAGYYVPCHNYCSTAEKQQSCREQWTSYDNVPAYRGECPRGQLAYDINPATVDDGVWNAFEPLTLRFTFDPAAGKLAGDVAGAPGTYTRSGADGAGNRARIVFEVGVK